MANIEHRNILCQGVETWNQWRAENPNTRPDLTRVDIGRESLVGVDLSQVNLEEANLSQSDLSQAVLKRANLRKANLSSAYLINTDLTGADLTEADINAATMKKAVLKEAILKRANLTEVQLVEANLRFANLRDARLKGANLRKADFTDADLREAKLNGADLSGADLSHANLRMAILNKANLNVARLRDANLDGAELIGTNLCGASLRWADLSGVKLKDADFSGSHLGWTKFADSDLSVAKGLGTVRHHGPSTIGIDTLYRSAGKIPNEFLRGCGVPDDFITFLPSLLGMEQVIQFYSCFISYSHKDESFSRRLYSRLRDAQIRIWFAPEDLKGGQKLYDQIESAIRYYDKLLIVLSENSLQSEWVMTEIRRARKAEIQGKRRKLFPIRLVDFHALQQWECFDADTGKDLAIEVREYFIPDFSNWKDHDAFEVAFDRLLKDLQASEEIV